MTWMAPSSLTQKRKERERRLVCRFANFVLSFSSGFVVLLFRFVVLFILFRRFVILLFRFVVLFILFRRFVVLSYRGLD